MQEGAFERIMKALARPLRPSSAEFAAFVQVYVEDTWDGWYAGEPQILAIRDALWPALVRHARLDETVPTVIASELLADRGLDYEQIAGVAYRLLEARWYIRQRWSTLAAS